ncbi:hypothetical protein LOK74_02905 [Brevibacillus humidisoli]|uniref:hypothetical protein n=1 Tax=Brevibacillus humidisoli TaxID=2895522 RepID=UPI001E43903A|nr:hypothetical protein [Brevibacillus humidisoli]UFJ41503.1 hypothetical protein LOK74_02905 [Brevibacillus humidisoli]
MGRDIEDRYRGLPPRTPEMLFRIVGKFYRGAVSHYDLIQEKKEDVRRAVAVWQETGEQGPLRQALWVLFCEFHFYVTCWLQIDLALYRLTQHGQNTGMAELWKSFAPQIQRHVKVREQLDDTESCVDQQFKHFGSQMAGVSEDRYWFDGLYFSVDQTSLHTLHQLYQAIMMRKQS